MSRARIPGLRRRLARSRHQLAKLKARLAGLPEHSQTEIAPLIDAYLHMLGPSRLMRGHPDAGAGRAHGRRGGGACRGRGAGRVAILELTGSDRAGRQRRAEEVREIARRLLRNLTHQPFRSFSGLSQGSILAATDLRPADAALIQPSHFAGHHHRRRRRRRPHRRDAAGPWPAGGAGGDRRAGRGEPPARSRSSTAMRARSSSTRPRRA